MKVKQFLFVLVLLAVATGAMAQMQAIPLDPQVRQGVLPNGLTYYIRHNEWPEHRCDFYIAQKVGSMQEEENQRGLAHFLEHMCFNGTTHFPGDNLKQYLERIGVKFGENLNAYTSFDETVYNVNNVNVEVPGAVDSCLLILHDWSHDLLLEDGEIDKERGVINEEWRMRRSAMMRMQETALTDLYPGSKYANRMPIGTMEIVMGFPYEDLRAYYRRWYRPDLQGLVIVGDINVDEIEAKIKAQFADIQPAETPSERIYFPVPDNEETLVTIQKDKEQPVGYMLMFMKTEATPREMKSSPEYLFMQYIMNAIETMLTTRMQELTQKPNPPFVGGGMGYGKYFISQTKDAWEATAICKDGEYLQAVEAAYREMLRAKRFGFTVSEYERFKKEYISQLEAVYNSRDKVENTAYVDEYVRHFLDNEPSPGIEFEYQVMQMVAQQVPLEAINQTVAMMPENNRAIALLLPDKEGIVYPTKEEVLATMAKVDAEEIEAYKEEVSDEPLVPELKSKAKVASIVDDVYGSKLITLTNGIKVHVLQTDYNPNNIDMAVTSWGGTSLYKDKDYLLAKSATMIEVGGWGNFTALELQKKLAGIQASVGPNIGDRTEGLTGSCVKKDLESLLQLTYLCFTAPHRDDDTYKSYMERLRAFMGNQELDPTTALKDTITKELYDNNIRNLRLRAADIEKLDYNKMLKIYKERFKNAADFEFYFVGDVDMDAITPLLEQYLGALPTSKAREKFNVTSNNMVTGQRTNIFEKEQDTPNANVVFVYHAPLKESLRNELMLSMLEQSMDMLFTETVREDEGGAYGVPVSSSLRDYPSEQGVIQIVLPTAPEKRERMTEIIYQGVEKMMAEGPSEDYLQKIREYMIRNHAEKLKDNGYWMSQLMSRTRYGYNFVDGYDSTVNSITVADIKALANTIFGSGNRVVVGMTSPQQ